MKKNLKKSRQLDFEEQHNIDEAKPSKSAVHAVVKEAEIAQEPETTVSVSAILKNARRKKGVNLSEVASDLRISQRYVTALEEGDRAHLPERVYTLGFVRSYAKYLNLDEEQILSQFKVEVLGDPLKLKLVFPKPVAEANSPRDLIIIFSTVAVILGFGGWLAYSKFNGNITQNDASEQEILESDPVNDENVAQPVEDSEESIVSNETQIPETLNQDEAEADVKNTASADTVTKSQDETPSKIIEAKDTQTTTPEIPAVQLIFTGESWIEVKDNEGKILVRKNFRLGESYVLPQKLGLKLSTGNAGAVKLSVDGKEGTVLGKVGEIKRISLEPETLKSYINAH
ncbi:helix-turn-helix domain-containing protein [Candidatus Nucleicultrix amoebiphila]|jgi:cytoskeletal protein RodZ|uniref:HTH cro/C1-type domain-containing protein n=1 Tax=Candidatus Nucleicultrix amoebiphila FS5 TaxID=1414854 RepID=A0A1W6N612_9PROT|nr:RodZ domain-containing protein [Candidatus Nucleicultrix amoebiphila]ARN85284.1 hypothetical protein GQ61_08280 [Candidatus Nucleicultrix amoebiphila FS5]